MPGSVAGKKGEEKGKRNEPNPPYKSRPRGRWFPPCRARSVPGSGTVGAVGAGARHLPRPPGVSLREGPPSPVGSTHVSRADNINLSCLSQRLARFPSRNHHSRGREAAGKKMTQKS